MKIRVESTHGELNFKGTNDRGQSLQFSGSKESVSPMEAVLMAAAACSSIDVEIFLNKMRQPFDRIEVDVQGDRVDAVPAVFSDIHLHYTIYGDVKPEKAKKAVEMSMEKYCSVSIMLQEAVKMTHSHEIINS
ncbi:MAG: OsmC family protein [Saprospiraceae bacterium]|nr:OsmC family protein [Saprospiraceae bacterium]